MAAEKYGKLVDPRVARALMAELGYGTKKRFGQNFLVDETVLDRIMEGAGITKEDTVLEIGPGMGTMTQALAERAGRVIAVEIDRDLIPVLRKTLAGFDNVTVLNKDILNTDLQTLDGTFSGGTYRVVANLPYYITTPILMKLLESGAPISSITVMVQKEVAERMQAEPGGKEYGALSLAVQYYCIPEILVKVPAGCFLPPPKVDSAVIRLLRREDPALIRERQKTAENRQRSAGRSDSVKKGRASKKGEISKKAGKTENTETAEAEKEKTVRVEDPAYMFRLIRAAFAQRRKTLVNALKNEPSLQLGKEQLEEALVRLGLPADVRGERLSALQFAALSNLLEKSLELTEKPKEK